jgi:hypothetical protein
MPQLYWYLMNISALFRPLESGRTFEAISENKKSITIRGEDYKG